MPALNPTRQNALLLVILLFAQLLLMAGSTRGEQGSTLLESGVLRVTGPLAEGAGAVAGGVRGGFEHVGELFEAKRENRDLRSENRNLRAEVSRLREAGLENERLRRVLGMRASLAPSSIGASVVAATLTDQERLVIIDRGTSHGVHVDLPVAAWGGAVGRVVSAGRGAAQVRLLTDPNSGVSGIIQRTRVEGEVLGRSERRMDMLYVPRYADVMLGDHVVTSGLDGVFPRGLSIGRVVFVGEDAGVSKVIRVRPEADFSRLEEVLVLLEPVGSTLLEGAEDEAGS
jgi:rod shape-determining protein MreC